MKQTKLQNYILIHAHLVINERKEYLDGMLVVRNGRIIDLQPQSHVIKEEYLDLPVLDVRGNTILPSDYAPLVPYRPDLTEADLFAQGIGSYELYVEKDIPFSLARIREQKEKYTACDGIVLKLSGKEIPEYLSKENISAFLIDPQEADPSLLQMIRDAGKKILFGDSTKTFAKEETVGEDVVFAQLFRSGEFGISDRRLLNLALDQEENYKIFRPAEENLHLLKLVCGHFHTDRLIFDLSGIGKEALLIALRREKIPYRQIAAYLGCNGRRCFGREELTLQKGRQASFYCVNNSGRILFSIREGVCYR